MDGKALTVAGLLLGGLTLWVTLASMEDTVQQRKPWLVPQTWQTDGNGATSVCVINEATQAAAHIKRIRCVVRNQKDLNTIYNNAPLPPIPVDPKDIMAGTAIQRDEVFLGEGQWEGNVYVFDHSYA